MTSREGPRLAELSLAIRESSLKRLRRVPEGSENWSITKNGMSFGDLAQHLIEADEWLFKKLEERDLEPMFGKAGAVTIGDRSEFDRMLQLLELLGKAKASLLQGLIESQLDEQITDIRFGGITTVWWVIVRGNLDHEIHHRGEIAIYLGVLESGGQ